MNDIIQSTEWSDAVYAYYRKRGLSEPDRKALRNTIIHLNGNPHSLPFCFSSGHLITFEEFSALAERSTFIYLPLTLNYDQRNLSMIRISEIHPKYFFHETIHELVVIETTGRQPLFLDDIGKQIAEGIEWTLLKTILMMG